MRNDNENALQRQADENEQLKNALKQIADDNEQLKNAFKQISDQLNIVLSDRGTKK